MLRFIKERKIKSTIPNNKAIAFGYEMVQVGADELERGHYNRFVELYEDSKIDEKTLLVEGLALSEKYLEIIFEWEGKEPENYVSQLLAGVARTYIAWQVRSGQWASALTDEQRNGFIENLELAERHLLAAVRLAPGDTEAYSRLIRVYMGLAEKEKALEFFQALQHLDQKHLGAHMFLFNLLTPKWLGSHEEMKEFAYQCLRKDPKGLLVVVYLMYIVEDYNIAEEKNMREAYKKMEQAFKKPIMELYASFTEIEFVSLQRYYLHNYFSYLFYVLGEKKLRDKEIALMNDCISFFPWSYYGINGLRDMKLFQLKY